MESWDELLETFTLGAPDTTFDSPCSERRVFYHYRLMIYVELATHGEVGLATCAEENGRLEQFEFDLAEVESRSKRLESGGFRRIGTWHHDENVGIIRTLVNDAEKVTFHISGTELSIENERMQFDDRATAEAEAETWLAELLADGYHLKRMWTGRSVDNPPRVDPPKLPELDDLESPSSPHEAVDLAVSRLTELHRLFPNANMIMELTEAGESARLENFPELDENSWQWQRLGRWLDLPEVDPLPTNSFDYLIERYGTLSWFLAGDWRLPQEVYTHRSNGHAGPTTPLEILPAETYPLLEDLARYEDEPDYLELKLFMSDEECNGFAFDTRFVSESGEHLIVWFEGHDGPALDGSEDDEIQPFGYWLLERVNVLTEALLPWLALIQGNSPRVESASNGEEKTYLEYRDEKSSKFWEIELNGASHTVRYGKIGTDGRSLTKDFDSPEDAEESAQRLIASKRKKGYEDATHE